MNIKQPEFGSALRNLRKIDDIGIGEAAARAGVSKGLLSRIERGADLQLSTLHKLASAYRFKIAFKLSQ